MENTSKLTHQTWQASRERLCSATENIQQKPQAAPSKQKERNYAFLIPITNMREADQKYTDKSFWP